MISSTLGRARSLATPSRCVAAEAVTTSSKQPNHRQDVIGILQLGGQSRGCIIKHPGPPFKLCPLPPEHVSGTLTAKPRTSIERRHGRGPDRRSGCEPGLAIALAAVCSGLLWLLRAGPFLVFPG